MKHSSRVKKLERRVQSYEDSIKKMSKTDGFHRPGSLKK